MCQGWANVGPDLFLGNLPTAGGVVSPMPYVRTKAAEAERLGNFPEAGGKKIYTQAGLQSGLCNPSSQTGVRLCVHVHTPVYSLGGQCSQEGGGISPEPFTENIPNVLVLALA